MASGVPAVTLALRDLDAQVGALGPEGAAARDELAAMVREFHRIQAAARAAAEAARREAAARQRLNRLRSTLEGFRKIVDPVGTALRSLQRDFASLRANAGALGTSLQELARLQRAAISDLALSVGGDLERLAREARGILGLDGLRAVARDIDRDVITPLSPRERLAQARAEFEAAIRAGLAGDVSAAQEASTLAREAIDLAREVYATGPAGQVAISEIRLQLRDLIEAQEHRESRIGTDVTEAVRFSADAQIDAIREQTRALVKALAEIRRALPEGAI